MSAKSEKLIFKSLLDMLDDDHDFKRMVNIIPEGRKGNVEIEHLEIGNESANMLALRMLVSGKQAYTPPGKYCRLTIGKQTVMSDTKMEHDTNKAVVEHAYGNVLIAGLGIGMILVPILAKDSVDCVTVIEANNEVIDLVAPHFTSDKLNIVLADIFGWGPEKDSVYDTIYFDIWPVICGDNLVEMRKLERRFKKHLSEGGWMDSWAKKECGSFRRRYR
jgi:hypothetical protein